jgi:hypothetical protein
MALNPEFLSCEKCAAVIPLLSSQEEAEPTEQKGGPEQGMLSTSWALSPPKSRPGKPDPSRKPSATVRAGLKAETGKASPLTLAVW